MCVSVVLILGHINSTSKQHQIVDDSPPHVGSIMNPWGDVEHRFSLAESYVVDTNHTNSGLDWSLIGIQSMTLSDALHNHSPEAFRPT